jgi:Flp pilus assembly protein TadD
MIDGNVRNARRLFAQAMTAPTDNSLAQAEWVVSRIGLRDLPAAESVPRSYEAAALTAVRAGDWSRALDACYEWLDDEPFSHKSAVMGSFVASTGRAEYGEGAVIATEGLIANPDDQQLRNNLIFALANDGQLDRAVREADRARVADMDADTLTAWTATVGLLNYRLGQPQVGRRHYHAAVAAAERQGNETMATIAALNWAVASLHAREPDAEQLREAALLRASNSSDPAVATTRARLIELSRYGEFPAPEPGP